MQAHFRLFQLTQLADVTREIVVEEVAAVLGSIRQLAALLLVADVGLPVGTLVGPLVTFPSSAVSSSVLPHTTQKGGRRTPSRPRRPR